MATIFETFDLLNYLNSQKISIKSTRTFLMSIKIKNVFGRPEKEKHNNNKKKKTSIYMYDRSTHSSLSKVTHIYVTVIRRQCFKFFFIYNFFFLVRFEVYIIYM